MAPTDTHGPDAPPTKPAAERVIIHVWVDSFYAAAETLRHDDFEDQPVVVGQGYTQITDPKGIVANANFEARKRGVHEAQDIADAMRRLPRMMDVDRKDEVTEDEAGYYCPIDMEYYEEVRRDIMDLFAETGAVVRAGELDTHFLDVSDLAVWPDRVDGDAETVTAEEISGEPMSGASDADIDRILTTPPTGTRDVSALAEAGMPLSATAFAKHLKQLLAEEFDMTASVGVAPTMAGAEIAAGHEKPDGLTVVGPGEVDEFLAALNVGKLPRVTPEMELALRESGVRTIGQVAAQDPDELADAFGMPGIHMYRDAHGVPVHEVTPRQFPPTISRDMWVDATAEWEIKRWRLQMMADEVAARARANDARYETVGITVMDDEARELSREKSLSEPAQDEDTVMAVAVELMEEFHDMVVTSIGVYVTDLQFGEGSQVNLENSLQDDSRTLTDDGAASGDDTVGKATNTELQLSPREQAQPRGDADAAEADEEEDAEAVPKTEDETASQEGGEDVPVSPAEQVDLSEYDPDDDVLQ